MPDKVEGRPSAEQMAEWRRQVEWHSAHATPGWAIACALQDELDAVTREKESLDRAWDKAIGDAWEALDAAKVGGVDHLSNHTVASAIQLLMRERDEARKQLSELIEYQRTGTSPGLAGMNFITNRERGSK